MANVLRSMSEEMAALVDRVGTSVVRVEGRRRMPASGVVWSEEGLIVTAHHVLEEDEVKVGLPDGTRLSGAVVGRDPTTDLALLRLPEKELHATAWVEPQSARVGHMVLALARPGKAVQATFGIVSALEQEWRTPAGGAVEWFLQTDLVMAPGFSGGPLVTMSGEVLGINSSALARGLSLALPMPTVRRVVESLLALGRVRRGYLGIGVQPARLPSPLAGTIGQETGILVNSVEPDGPADRAGLIIGDVLLALDGRPLLHPESLMALLHGDRVGQPATLRLLRAGKVEECRVTVGERL